MRAQGAETPKVVVPSGPLRVTRSGSPAWVRGRSVVGWMVTGLWVDEYVGGWVPEGLCGGVMTEVGGLRRGWVDTWVDG